MYRFGEMNEIMEQATKENELIINENDKLKERNSYLECKVEELEEEIEKLKQMVSTTANIGYKFMKKNKPRRPFDDEWRKEKMDNELMFVKKLNESWNKEKN
tara:strand:- start:361 stop:666 length:306 start_codon:yes stop_codon:yes gene_type:complete